MFLASRDPRHVRQKERIDSLTYYYSSLWKKQKYSLLSQKKTHKHVCCIGKPGTSQIANTATGTRTTATTGSLGLLLYV